MTLIAGFVRDDCPILIGDVLISDQDESDKEFTFPTVGKIGKRDLHNGSFSPSHLCQKVILVSPMLAICWANTKIYAKTFVKAIIEAKAHNTPSYALLSDIYQDIRGQGSLSIIGLFRNGTEMGVIDFDSWPVDPPYSGFNYFKAAGSGYGSLLDTIPHLQQKITSGNPNRLENAIATAIQLNTSLLSKEIMSPASLHELFGVGYEIAYPLGRGLAKFSNLTYIFWTAEEVTTGAWVMQPFPFLTFNYSYVGDVLIIRAVRASSIPKSSSCRIDSDELHAISPLHRFMNPEELTGYSPASLNSEWICTTFLWKDCQGQVGAFSTFGHYMNQPAPIIWTDEFGNGAGIDVNTEFIRTSISKVALHASEQKAVNRQ